LAVRHGKSPFQILRKQTAFAQCQGSLCLQSKKPS